MKLYLNLTPEQLRTVSLWVEYKKRTEASVPLDLTSREAMRALLLEALAEAIQEMDRELSALSIQTPADIPKRVRDKVLHGVRFGPS